MPPIRITDPAFNILCELDAYSSFSFTRKYHGIGDFELHMNRHALYAEMLTEGNILLCGDLSGIITYRERNATDKASSDTQVVKGVAGGGLLGRRITVPPTGQGYDVFNTDAESVMHGLVDHNAIHPFADIADNPTLRVIPRLIAATNQHRGPQIQWQSRYKQLEEELEQISLFSGLGWEVAPDIVNRRWVFWVTQGRDLTIHQSVNNPVIFSPEFDNIQTQRSVESNSGYRSTAYVAGQEEGADRRVAIAGGEHGGLERFELFVDARDLATDTDLPARGLQKLTEYPRLLTLQASVAPSGAFLYRQDWDLGDIVTVRNPEWGLTLDARITQIQEVVEPKGNTLAVNFGAVLPTFMDRIKKDLSQTAQETTR